MLSNVHFDYHRFLPMSQLQSELSNYRLGHTEKWLSTQSLGKASKNGTTPRMQYRRSEHQQPRMAFATPVHYLGGSQGLTRLPYQLGGQWGRIETHSPGTCDPTMPSPQTPCWSMGFESASFTICSFFFFLFLTCPVPQATSKVKYPHAEPEECAPGH